MPAMLVTIYLNFKYHWNASERLVGAPASLVLSSQKKYCQREMSMSSFTVSKDKRLPNSR